MKQTPSSQAFDSAGCAALRLNQLLDDMTSCCVFHNTLCFRSCGLQQTDGSSSCRLFTWVTVDRRKLPFLDAPMLTTHTQIIAHLKLLIAIYVCQ